jgi:uncharacterized membrane-anchored protein
MTITEPYTTVAAQARQATEKSVEAWRNGAKTLADQFGQFTIPAIDLSEQVTGYFDYLQRAVDFNRDLAIRWAELVSTLSGSVREQSERVADIVQDQTDAFADLNVRNAAKVEQTAKEQAATAARAQRQQARDRYEGLTKTELADRLAERGLPKTGTVEELIERLVNADTQ